jgi:ribosomal protein S18 acetylase RimI-like enzyme
MSQVDRRSAAQQMIHRNVDYQGGKETTDYSDWKDQLIIRRLEAGDLRSIEWDGEYTHLRQVYERAYQKSKNGITILWVAELPGFGIIGQVFLQLSSERSDLADGHNRAYLYSLRVKPAFRSMGFGTRLMEVAESTLCEMGYLMVTLTVAKNNHRAIQLYKRCGYRIVASEAGLWNYQDDKGKWQSIREPAWRMEKNLNY